MFPMMSEPELAGIKANGLTHPIMTGSSGDDGEQVEGLILELPIFCRSCPRVPFASGMAAVSADITSQVD